MRHGAELRPRHHRAEARGAAAAPPRAPRPVLRLAARALPPAVLAVLRLPRRPLHRALDHAAAAESAVGGIRNGERTTGVKRQVKAAVGTETGKKGPRRRTGRGRVQMEAGRENGRHAANGIANLTEKRKGAKGWERNHLFFFFCIQVSLRMLCMERR